MGTRNLLGRRSSPPTRVTAIADTAVADTAVPDTAVPDTAAEDTSSTSSVGATTGSGRSFDPQRPDQGGATRRGDEDTADTPTARKVKVVHRVGAFAVAGVLATFGLLGFIGGLAFFSTDGGTVAGLSSNGLLSTISLLTAVLLVASALRGGRQAGIVMIGFGIAFLLSAFWHLFVLNTSLNILAFSMANVIFSIVAGIVLLTLGLYGRVSGNLPADSPYHPHAAGSREAEAEEEPELLPATPAERRAEREMRDAEIAVSERRGTTEQARRVEAMGRVRTKTERRRVWMEHSGS